jgi:hypothetical protein
MKRDKIKLVLVAIICVLTGLLIYSVSNDARIERDIALRSNNVAIKGDSK